MALTQPLPGVTHTSDTSFGDLVGGMKRQWGVIVISTVLFTLIALAACIVVPKQYQSQAVYLLDGRTQSSPVPYGPGDIDPLLTNPQATYDIVTAMNGLTSLNMVILAWQKAGIQKPSILTDAALDSLPSVRAEQRNQSNAVVVTSVGPNERDVYNFLLELSEVYSEEVRKQTEEAGKSGLAVISSKIETAQAEIDKLQKESNEFKVKNSMADSSVQAEVSFRRLAELQTQASVNKAAYEGAMAARARAEVEFNAIPSTVKRKLAESNIEQQTRESAKLGELEQARAALRRRYTDEHPDVRALTDQIALQQATVNAVPKDRVTEREEPNPLKEDYKKIVTQMRAAEEAARAAYTGTQGALTRESAAVPATTANVAQLQQIESAIKEKQALLGVLKENEQRISLKINNIRRPLRVLASASPSKLVRPIVPLYVGLGVVFGLLLGCFLAISRDNLNDKVTNAETAEYLTGANLLASIPRRKKSGNPAIEAHHRSVSFESYRLLRTSLLLRMGDQKPKQVLFTSMLPGEGVSVVAANLATACAAAGLRTIFVDANFRRPSGTSLFGLHPDVRGLGEALATSAPVETYLTETGTEGLRVLAIGAVPSNIGEALASPRMKQLIDELGRQADVVFYDTAAYAGVADPVSMAPLVGNVVCVCVPGLTPRAELKDFVEMMSIGKVPILGVVMNKTEGSRAGDSMAV